MIRDKPKNCGETGFTLIEVMIAMVIILVGMLGLLMTYAAAVRYNAGNNLRLQALAVLQQEAERMRSAQFTPTATDEILYGGVKAVKHVTTADGGRFQVLTVVDDDPFTADVQVDPGKTLKSITITVSAENNSQAWAAAIPATVTLRRVRGN